MRVFVTGGTGFIGANVVRAHLARGDRVRCLVRASSPGVALEGLPVERVEAALDDAQALRTALRGCDAIQHLAGVYDTSPGGSSRMYAVHVDATRALGEAALDLGIQRMVVCSSSITVGFGSMDRPGDEDTPIPDADRIYPPGTALGAYFDSKVKCEAVTRDLVHRGLEAVLVNPDYVVGAWDVKPTSGQLILTMGRAWVPFYPRGGKCFITAEDCAQGHVLALENGRPGQRYLLGTENLTYHQFMNLVARVVGAVPPAVPLPRTATDAMGLLVDRATGFLPAQARQVDVAALASMQADRYRSGRRSWEELGVPRSPLRWGIEAAWKWFVDHGYPRRKTRWM